LPPHSANAARGRFQGFRPTTGDHDVGPGLGEGAGETGTQTTARPGHDRDAARDPEQVKHTIGRRHRRTPTFHCSHRAFGIQKTL
jgi:hypothetical protein